MTDLTTKSMRAEAYLHEVGVIADTYSASDRVMIAMAEDRGWQDQEQEADRVEWVTTIADQAEMPSPQPGEIGPLELTATQGPWTDGQWEWKLTECGIVMVDSGTAPTRAEARAAAVESARGMG